jgi:glycerophosphoryl diester phosphodiesterase
MMNPLLRPHTRLVIGHRGNAMFAPENTLPSIAQALECGADAVEIDVRISADGEAVVIHDNSVDRTTSGHGAVEFLTLGELQSLDAGARFTSDAGRSFPYRLRGITIPTLGEVLRTFPTTPIVVEVKTEAAQQRVLEVVREENAADRTVLASFDKRAVSTFRANGIMTGASRSELFSMFVRSVLRLPPRHFDFHAIFLPRRYFGVRLSEQPVVRASSPTSIPVHLWVENNPAAAQRLWRSGVCGIVTDDPATLVALRDSV